MAPELLRFSSYPEKAERFQPHLRAAHRPSENAQLAPRAVLKNVGVVVWDDDDEQPVGEDATYAHDDGADLAGVLDDLF